MESLTLANETIEAEVLPGLGARLHRLRAFGHDLLRTPPDLGAYEREPFFWGSYTMAPWCNRVSTERTVVGTRVVALTPNFPDGSAIHGQVYRAAWETDDGLTDTSATTRVRGGGDEWPWEYELAQSVVLSGSTLSLGLTLENRSVDPMPGGLGFHPWFRKPIRVAIHANRVHSTNLDSETQPKPVSGPLDRRQLTEMPDDLDATWTDVDDPAVELAWPDLRVRATMRIAGPSVFVVAASPAGLDAVAVEPQTHAPQGLRRMVNGEPGALVTLPPGHRIHLEVTLAFERD